MWIDLSTGMNLRDSRILISSLPFSNHHHWRTNQSILRSSLIVGVGIIFVWIWSLYLYLLLLPGELLCCPLLRLCIWWMWVAYVIVFIILDTVDRYKETMSWTLSCMISPIIVHAIHLTYFWLFRKIRKKNIKDSGISSLCTLTHLKNT